jgi:hypothetical protein
MVNLFKQLRDLGAWLLSSSKYLRVLLKKSRRDDLIIDTVYQLLNCPEGMSLLALQDDNITLSGFKNTLCKQSYNNITPSGFTICIINN